MTARKTAGKEPRAGREAIASEPTAPARSDPPDLWDAAHELEIDRRVERRLLVRELCVLVVIASLVVLRILFVHGT